MRNFLYAKTVAWARVGVLQDSEDEPWVLGGKDS